MKVVWIVVYNNFFFLLILLKLICCCYFSCLIKNLSFLRSLNSSESLVVYDIKNNHLSFCFEWHVLEVEILLSGKTSKRNLNSNCKLKKKTLYFVLRLHPVFVKVTFTLQFASYSPQVYKWNSVKETLNVCFKVSFCLFNWMNST